MTARLPRFFATTALFAAMAINPAHAQDPGAAGSATDGVAQTPEPAAPSTDGAAPPAVPEAPSPAPQAPAPQAPQAPAAEMPAPQAPAPSEQAPSPDGSAGTDGAGNREDADPAAPRPEESQGESVVPALPAPPVDEATPGKTPADVSQSTVTMPPARADHGPQSVSDLAESLLDAVVNISTSQRVERPGGGIPPLEAPEGSPLQDFFDDLLRGDDSPSGSRVQSLGSGFVIDPSGIVVTNNHVIQDADEITVNFADGSKLEAELLGRDPKTDLAVLKVDAGKELPSVAFGDSEEIRIGDWVMAIGNPFGLGGSVSIGIVSARGRNINAGPYDNFIQTDAAINRGNSGGPLFDMDGDVVGINTAIMSPTGGSIGIGFSVPSNLAVNVVNQLREFGETRRGWLGVRLSAVTDDIANGLGIGEAKGAVVVGTIDGGPSVGVLKAGDVITSFDGKSVETSRDLPRIVAETPVGKEVDVEILRKTSRDTDAEPETVQITLGRLEDGERQMASADGEPGDGTAEGSGEAEPDGGESEASPETDEAEPVLGLTLGAIDEAARQAYGLAEDASGVLVTEVVTGSNAEEKGIEPGMTIREVAQETVSSVEEVEEKLADLRERGRRNALMLLADPGGDLRFVVLPLD
ncbi:Do family serine endopeptidase [Fulvimarina sp. 2208YS6-2-32]|uniref:Do family serine endopeptidase n=1 Tax=Fulvimarina uroteuthidis TaxID=3098149 RepID=A0ABU5HZQ3_9HYPH|nr:Do family serine endopeptidase [Fulvimarina sp. 2208YS6-2-32]MDY8108614.1 Do family serine endopeptidase [Fulvimarina sp. 2208YS6-2-32]